jgi:hypothetical protein
LLLISSSGCRSVLQNMNLTWVIFLLVLIVLNSISRLVLLLILVMQALSSWIHRLQRNTNNSYSKNDKQI